MTSRNFLDKLNFTMNLNVLQIRSFSYPEHSRLMQCKRRQPLPIQNIRQLIHRRRPVHHHQRLQARRVHLAIMKNHLRGTRQNDVARTLNSSKRLPSHCDQHFRCHIHNLAGHLYILTSRPMARSLIALSISRFQFSSAASSKEIKPDRFALFKAALNKERGRSEPNQIRSSVLDDTC